MRTPRTPLCLALTALCAAPALARAQESPPAPPPLARVETVPPSPGPAFAWVPGHWHWDGARFLWVPGGWERPPYVDARWVPPAWVYRDGRWVFVRGAWRREAENPLLHVARRPYQYGWGWPRWGP